MSRPVGANAEETRQKILTSASALFAKHGFEGTSVRQIARGASVSLGMIRHYFGSKEGLYRACMQSAYAIYLALGQQIRSGIDAGGTPAKVVGEAMRSGFRFALANKAALRLVQWDLMQQDTWRHEPGDSEMLPFIHDVARVLGPPAGRGVGETALIVRSLIFLVARHATADHDELASLVEDRPGARASDATLLAIERHLVEMGTRIFS